MNESPDRNVSSERGAVGVVGVPDAPGQERLALGELLLLRLLLGQDPGSWALTTWSLATRPSYATWTSAIFGRQPVDLAAHRDEVGVDLLEGVLGRRDVGLEAGLQIAQLGDLGLLVGGGLLGRLALGERIRRSSPRTDGAAGAAKIPAMRGIRRTSSRKRPSGGGGSAAAHPGAYVRISEASVKVRAVSIRWVARGRDAGCGSARRCFRRPRRGTPSDDDRLSRDATPGSPNGRRVRRSLPRGRPSVEAPRGPIGPYLGPRIAHRAPMMRNGPYGT